MAEEKIEVKSNLVSLDEVRKDEDFLETYERRLKNILPQCGQIKAIVVTFDPISTRAHVSTTNDINRMETAYMLKVLEERFKD